MCKSNDKGAVLMMFDFKKAFDSLTWYFLYQTLKQMNFGNSFIHWSKTLYNDPTAMHKNNGYLSRDTYWSIRQGCPISALLFIIAVEVMASDIKYNDQIKCVTIENMERC